MVGGLLLLLLLPSVALGGHHHSQTVWQDQQVHLSPRFNTSGPVAWFHDDHHLGNVSLQEHNNSNLWMQSPKGGWTVADTGPWSLRLSVHNASAAGRYRARGPEEEEVFDLLYAGPRPSPLVLNVYSWPDWGHRTAICRLDKTHPDLRLQWTELPSTATQHRPQPDWLMAVFDDRRATVACVARLDGQGVQWAQADAPSPVPPVSQARHNGVLWALAFCAQLLVVATAGIVYLLETLEARRVRPPVIY